MPKELLIQVAPEIASNEEMLKVQCFEIASCFCFRNSTSNYFKTLD